jgi:hypothetical protein
MSKLVIAFLNADERAMLAAAGHHLVTTAESQVPKLITAAAAKYPALVAAFKEGFDEVENDTTVTGFAKMAKVAEIVAPKVPEIAAELADLPNLESFLLQFGQTVWTAAIPDLESAAVALVAKLV